MTRLHDSLTVIDGLVISKWSRAIFADMRAGGLTASPEAPAIYSRLSSRTRGARPRNCHNSMILHLPISIMREKLCRCSLLADPSNRRFAGLESSIAPAPIRQSGNLLFTVLSWLLRWLLSAVISLRPASKSQSFRRQSSPGRCSFAALSAISASVRNPQPSNCPRAGPNEPRPSFRPSRSRRPAAPRARNAGRRHLP